MHLGPKFKVSFRADKPFPPHKLEVDYFEVTVIEGDDKATTAIGFCSEFANLAVSLGGHRHFSIAYHSDDGYIYEGIEAERPHKPVELCEVFGKQQTVGCGVDWDTKEVFFTLNGELQSGFISCLIFYIVMSKDRLRVSLIVLVLTLPQS